MSRKLPSLTVFFPFLDDSRSIGELLDGAAQAASACAETHDLLVIDDGSEPGEAERLRREASRRGARVVRHERTLGYGAALRRGFAETGGEWVFYTDGDGQYDPTELSLLWREWDARGRPDVVNGYKARRDDPPHRRLLGEAYRAFTRAAFRLPVRDVNCDFRLMRSHMVKSLPLRCDGGGIGLELLHLARLSGASFAEVPVSHLPRRFGRSRFFSARNVLRLAAETARTAWRAG